MLAGGLVCSLGLISCKKNFSAAKKKNAIVSHALLNWDHQWFLTIPQCSNWVWAGNGGLLCWKIMIDAKLLVTDPLGVVIRLVQIDQSDRNKESFIIQRNCFSAPFSIFIKLAAFVKPRQKFDIAIPNAWSLASVLDIRNVKWRAKSKRWSMVLPLLREWDRTLSKTSILRPVPVPESNHQLPPPRSRNKKTLYFYLGETKSHRVSKKATICKVFRLIAIVGVGFKFFVSTERCMVAVL